MSASLALARREIVRFFRQPSRVIGAVLPPILAWVLIGSGFGTSFRVPGSGDASGSYFSYFFPEPSSSSSSSHRSSRPFR